MVNENVKPKRSPGRPKGRQQREFVGLRITPELVEKIDTWRAGQPGAPTRSEAIRTLIELALDKTDRR